MAWSWSHTAEAYAAVERQIRAKDREWLEVVWAEWKTAVKDEHGCYGHEFDQDKYQEKLAEAKTMADDVLADEIWELTQEYATCSNGGWKAYCCPFDCGPHEIPFTPEGEEEDTD